MTVPSNLPDTLILGDKISTCWIWILGVTRQLLELCTCANILHNKPNVVHKKQVNMVYGAQQEKQQ